MSATQGEVHLLTVWMGTVSGKPASSMAMRHSMCLCDPGASTVPTIRSPIACKSRLPAEDPDECPHTETNARGRLTGIVLGKGKSKERELLGWRGVTSGSTPVCLRTATRTANNRSSAGVSLKPPFLACSRRLPSLLRDRVAEGRGTFRGSVRTDSDSVSRRGTG